MPQFFYDAKGAHTVWAHKEKQSDCCLNWVQVQEAVLHWEQWFHGQHQGAGSCRWSTTDIGVVAATTIRWHGVCTTTVAQLCAVSATIAVWDSFGTNIAVRLSARRSIRGATSRKGRSGIIGGPFAGNNSFVSSVRSNWLHSHKSKVNRHSRMLGQLLHNWGDGLIFWEDMMWLVCRKVYVHLQWCHWRHCFALS